ncbi:hypothetical protein [Aminobacter ciceronei]|jgi:hypothetical protein|uniref:hypothetical protein n=1 Tax=Aminobacter ciceronei TaxID=150723 RepID=UPI003F729941
MTTVSYDRPATFRIGRVFGDTFNVLGRNLGLCIGLGAIFSGVPTFLYQYFVGSRVEAAIASAESGAAVAPPEFNGTYVLTGVFFFVVYMVLASILQAALVRATIQDLNGQQATFADALSRAVTMIVPIIGLSVLVYLGVGFASLLLLIPGIYLLVRWSVAVPVLVQEQPGVLASMKRSSELTAGNRWRILGLLVIVFVALWVMQLVLGLLSLAIVPLLGTVVATGVAAMLSAVLSGIISIAVAVSYVELRYVKEGTDVKELAEIFA